MRHLFLIMFFLLLFLISSCKRSKTYNPVLEDTLISRVISFPSGLYYFSKNNFFKPDSIWKKVENKIKIFSIVDGNCASCIIHHMNKVDSIFSDILLPDTYLIFILNVKKEDSVYFLYNYSELIKTNSIIFWDNNYNFEKHNKLFTNDINKRTFLVNKLNRIIMYGNPLYNRNLISEYSSVVKNLVLN